MDKPLVKFSNEDMEVALSQSELSDVKGGKGLLGAILDLLSVDINNNCGGCNDNCTKK